jgi:hypothetical protein
MFLRQVNGNFRQLFINLCHAMHHVATDRPAYIADVDWITKITAVRSRFKSAYSKMHLGHSTSPEYPAFSGQSNGSVHHSL